MKSRLTAVAAASAALLTGCFTVSQSEFPAVEMTKARDGTATRVALSGFEALFTTYTPVYGYSTVWRSAPGYYRHGRYHYGADYPETVSTTTYIPRTDVSRDYAEMAQDSFEAAGFVVAATNAQYMVNVKFSGPETEDGDRAWEALTLIFSLLTADYTAETWSARLKITDMSTGRVMLLQTYEQRYHAAVWGLVPLFSPLAADAVEDTYIKRWCLSALTCRAVADATAFLSGASAGMDGAAPKQDGT